MALVLWMAAMHRSQGLLVLLNHVPAAAENGPCILEAGGPYAEEWKLPYPVL